MRKLSTLLVLIFAACIAACSEPDKNNKVEVEPCTNTACSACKETPAEEEAHDPVTIEIVWLKVDGMTKVQGIT